MLCRACHEKREQDLKAEQRAQKEAGGKRRRKERKRNAGPQILPPGKEKRRTARRGSRPSRNEWKRSAEPKSCGRRKKSARVSSAKKKRGVGSGKLQKPNAARGRVRDMRHMRRILYAGDCRRPNLPGMPAASHEGAQIPDARGRGWSAAQSRGRRGRYKRLPPGAPAGQGRHGEVWLVEEEKTKKQMALKLMLPKVAADKRARAMFVREALVADRLNHKKHCPAVQERGIKRGVLYPDGTMPGRQCG